MRNRILAMKWWNLLEDSEKSSYCKKYSIMLHANRPPESLTGREINSIWEIEVYNAVRKFAIGQVIRITPKHEPVIVTGYQSIKLKDADGEYTKEICTWLSISSSNCTGRTPVLPEEEELHCIDCTDDDCEDCHGSGKYTNSRFGMTQAVLIADNIKAYIIQSLTRNFKF